VYFQHIETSWVAWKKEKAMDEKSTINLSMASPAVYQITVNGMMGGHWADWFGADVIECGVEGKIHTVLTCQVRDQAELLGILNRLNGMNLPLLQVTIIKKDE
jgi:hypothetical protein